MDFPNSWQQLREDMMNCEQTPGQSVWEHGSSVYDTYRYIEEILAYGTDSSKVKPFLDRFKLPDWFFEYEEGLAWERLPSAYTYKYTYWHDCGKPYCKIVDEDGRFHFPNHVNVSARVWLHLCEIDPPISSDRNPKFSEIVGELIKRDMEIHTIKAADVEEFCRDKSIAVTLLLVGLAEIHANASMFGGIDSTSFKIKYKQIERRGRAICKHLNLETEPSE